MGSGLRFWPHLSPGGPTASSSPCPSSRIRVLGARRETCCAFWTFDSDRPDRYLQGAGLRAAAGRWARELFPSRSLRLTGKTSRPGLAFRGPLAGSHRQCQEGKNNGGNDAIQRLEAAIVTGLRLSGYAWCIRHRLEKEKRDAYRWCEIVPARSHRARINMNPPRNAGSLAPRLNLRVMR